MLLNYIKIAYRNLQRQFTFTFINILGLALGLGGAFVIGNWVWQELKYEKHFIDHEKIVRVSVSFYNSGAFAQGPFNLVPTLLAEAPEITLGTSFTRGQETLFSIGEDAFKETPLFADSVFFELFSYPFVAGNPQSVLDEPKSMVITQSVAKQFFNTTDVSGKTIEVGDEEKEIYTISGVIADNQLPSHIPQRIWLSSESGLEDNWTSARSYNFVKLKDGYTIDDLENRLEFIREHKVFPTFKTQLSYAQWKETDFFHFHTRALDDIHLKPGMRFELSAGGNRANVYIFSAITLFLIFIAAINFINLSTAISVKRAREVGIRKTLGSSRESLIGQYLLESVLLSVFAACLGVLLGQIFLQLFENQTGEKLIAGLFGNDTHVILFFGLSIIIGLLAGAYPAFYTSRYKPAQILKNSSMSPGGKSTLRNTLVVVQFTLSIALIISSLLVFNQLNHLRKVDVGLDRENVLIVENVNELGAAKEVFKQEMAAQAGVTEVSFNKRIPAGSSLWISSYQTEAMEKAQTLQTFVGDANFIPVMGIQLLEGRNFSVDIASDTASLILNESAVKELMLEEPIGAVINENEKVIGVVGDFMFESFNQKPEPAVIQYDPEGYRLSMKVSGGNVNELISIMEEKWQDLNAAAPIHYSFLDQKFEKLMEKEKTLGRTILFFTALAIIISCLGLFGLAAYTTENRKKEIGIRKVFGAGMKDIILLLNTGFSKLVIISLLLSVPITYYLLQKWLQNYVYQTELHAWIFLVSGAIALVIAWITVSYLSFRSARINPVNALQEE